MPVKERRGTVAIIGAGIVGVSTAIWLQRAGLDAVLIDRNEPGEGASFGNGGVLASCSVVPVTTPGLLAKAPRMLFDPNQPLFLKWPYLPRLMPWLARYLSHANEKDVRRIAAALCPIIGDSLADHQRLASGTDAEKRIVPSDYLYLYNDREHFNSDAFAWSVRRDNGFEWDELEGPELTGYDNVFRPELKFAIRLRNHGQITDPGQYVKELARHFEEKGGRIVRAEVSGFDTRDGTVNAVRTNDDRIDCSAIVITGGAWSKPLASRLGLDLPLESERGYHLELWEPNLMPRAPVMVAAKKFVIAPMDGRIRLAGIVEFGGLKAPPSRAPFDLLRQYVQWAMPGLTWKEEREWMGHRPAPSDSIPVIGEAPGMRNAYLGFGHHHVGLTGGPRTGQILAGLISGDRPNIDLAPYSPSRFQ